MVGGSRCGKSCSGGAYLDGDADLNGTVDGADFLVWNDNKFSETAAWCSGDFDANGTVDGADFLLWNANKFQTSDTILASYEREMMSEVALFTEDRSVLGVPEPASGLMMICFGVAMGMIRRRK